MGNLHKPGGEMRELRDIPNKENYEFTGICKDGSKIPCIVHRDSVGIHCASSLVDDLKCYDKLIGWENKPQ